MRTKNVKIKDKVLTLKANINDEKMKLKIREKIMGKV